MMLAPNDDPIMSTLSKMAMASVEKRAYFGLGMNYMHDGFNFSKPTSHPRGYYALLAYINDNPDVTVNCIRFHFRNCMNAQLMRLLCGKMIDREQDETTKRDKYLYSITEFGKLYLMVAKGYLAKRKEMDHSKLHLLKF